MALTIGTVATGIGGIDLGFERQGFHVAWQAEIDPHCQQVLRRHFPDAAKFFDMTACGKDNLHRVSVFAGGTPCQGFSIAGLRESLTDDRSNLCLQFCRIADEIEPTVIIWENVPGVLSTEDNAFGCFLAALVGADAPLIPPRAIKRWRQGTRRPDCAERCKDAEGKYQCGHRVEPFEYFAWTDAGVVVGPKRTAAWRILDSQFVGVAQRRERVYVVASPHQHEGQLAAPNLSEPDGVSALAAEILFERESMRRHSPPSREEGEETASTLTHSTRKSSPHGGATGSLVVDRPDIPVIAGTLGSNEQGGLRTTDLDGTGAFIPESITNHDVPDVAWCWQERDGKGPDSNTKTGHLIAASIRTAQQSSNGHGVALNVAHALDGANGQAVIALDPNPQPDDPCHTLPSSAKPPAVAIYRNAGDGAAYDCGDVAAPLTTATELNAQIVTGPAMLQWASGGGDELKERAQALRSNAEHNYQLVVEDVVRRLTPVECERLQGFPDDWSAWGLTEAGERVAMSDSARYKQAGNAVTVNAAEWIAARTKRALEQVTPGML